MTDSGVTTFESSAARQADAVAVDLEGAVDCRFARETQPNVVLENGNGLTEVLCPGSGDIGVAQDAVMTRPRPDELSARSSFLSVAGGFPPRVVPGEPLCKYLWLSQA